MIEIGGDDYDHHPIYKEWKYYIERRSIGNDSAKLEWIGSDKKTPLINEYLLSNRFNKGEEVLYWVCW